MNERDSYGDDNWISRSGQKAGKNFLNMSIPRPPSASKRSIAATVNSPRSYVPSRPPLLRDIEEFLAKKLTDISTEEPMTEDWLSNKRLRVYREAFQLYIDEFNIYKPFLNAVKYEYECTLDFFSSRYNQCGISVFLNSSFRSRNFVALKTDLVSKERENIQKLKAKDAAHENIIRELQAEKAALERQIVERDRTIGVLQTQACCKSDLANET